MGLRAVAFKDIPMFPREFKPRGDRLIQMMQEHKISGPDVLNNVLSTLGTLRVSSNGIEITGSFGSFVIDSLDFNGLMETVNRSVDWMPVLLKRLNGHQLIIRVGDKVTKLTLKIPPRREPSSMREIEESDLPAIELPSPGQGPDPSELLLKLFALLISNQDLTSFDSKPIDFKFRRYEEMLDWLGEGWQFAEEGIDIALPSLRLLSKQTMDRLGEDYPAFWDEVLRKCGV